MSVDETTVDLAFEGRRADVEQDEGGALDGGLTGALVLYGADPASAAAAVLVYHAIVLWVPTLLGTIAFLRLRPTLHEPVVLGPERAR